MAFSKTEQRVYDIVKPIAEENDAYVYDVEYVKEGGFWFLKVYDDKEECPITLDECEVISRRLSEELDRDDFITQNYYLEVASPGIDRKLKTKEHFDRYIGELVDIGLYKAVNGSKNITGELLGFEDKTISVEIDGEKMELAQSETTFVKLHFEF